MQLATLQLRQLGIEVIGLAHILFQVIELIVLHATAAILKQEGNVFRHIGKFTLLDSVERFEVIVDVLQAGLTQTADTIDQLAGKVVALIVIKSFLQHRIIIQTAHGYCSGTLHLLDELLFKLHRTHGPAQPAQILVQEGSHRTFKVVLCKLQHLGQLFTCMVFQQLHDFGIVTTLHQTSEGFVALLFCLALLVHHLAADKQEDSQRNQCQDGNRTAKVDEQRHEEADGERSTGRNEPTANNTQHTRDAEHGRVTSPGTVGQRSTHSHHEGHVGGRQRQLQRSTQGNQQTCQHQIDRSTHHIEGCAIGNDGLVLAEAGIYPAFCIIGNNF